MLNNLSKILDGFNNPRTHRRAVACIFGLAILFRLIVLVAFWPSWDWHTGDIPDSWDKLAINLVDHGTFGFYGGDITVTRGPIFPIVEMPLYLIFGANYAGWSITLLLLDAFTCLLLMWTVCRTWGSRPALLAGLFYSVNIPIIYYTAKISQVTSILPLVVLWMYFFKLWDSPNYPRWLPYMLGIVSGVLILNKTVYLPVPFLGVAFLLWRRRRDGSFVRVINEAVISLVLMLLVVLPWTVRNFVVTGGRIVPVQSMFWELFVQDVLYYDLGQMQGVARPDGELLKYMVSREAEMLAANGVSTIHPKNETSPRWEVSREKAFQRVSLDWLRADPGKVVRVKIRNIWNFWIRAENLGKTRMMTLMQIAYLSSTLFGLYWILKYREVDRIQFGLLLVVVLWAEHCLVFAWGRFSLDTVPVLGLIFGVGVDAWSRHSVSNRQVAYEQYSDRAFSDARTESSSV